MKEVIYKKILVTLDGSRLAATAVPYALAFAKNLNTKIVLLWVVESVGEAMVGIQPADLAPPVSMIGTTAVELVQYNKEAAQKYLQKMKDELESAGAAGIETKVTEGVPEEEIVAFAKKEKVDLIIMSTHGTSGLRRTFLGSVADYVVRHALCPVLLVHPQKKKRQK